VTPINTGGQKVEIKKQLGPTPKKKRFSSKFGSYKKFNGPLK
jgi:hypothetical protein